MSIIFKKLKNLKQNFSDSGSQAHEKLRQGQGTDTFGKLIFSPKGALLFFTVIFVFGFASFYSLSVLKNILDSGTRNAIIVTHDPGPDPAQDPAQDMMDPSLDDANAPPEGELLPGQVPGAPEKGREEKIEGFKVPRYFEVTSAGPAFLEKQAPIPRKKEQKQAAAPMVPVKKNPVLKKEKAQQEQDRQIKNSQAEKISKMADLSSSLEEAVRQNDSDRIAQLLEKLSDAADKQSAYYLKLLAYQAMTKQNYSQARTLLNTVIENDPADLEAGLNMAIIEIKESDVARAEKRLLQLKSLYPSHPLVEQLLNQL